MSEPIQCPSCGAEISDEELIACEKCAQECCSNCSVNGLCPECSDVEYANEPDDSPENAEGADAPSAPPDGLFPEGVDAEDPEPEGAPEPPPESVERIKLELQQALKGTATPHWKKFYQWTRQQKQIACAALETSEKTREIVALQTRVAVMKEIEQLTREPVSFFNELRQEHPLVCGEVKPGWAHFDSETGVVTFLDRKDADE